MHVAGAKAGRAALHQEAVNAIIGFGPDDGDIGNTTIGNPHFGTIQDIRIAIAPRRRAHTAGVAAPIRRSQACCGPSEPTLWIGNIASEPCTETNDRKPLSPASNSWQARP